ncbi:MAG TPA: ABC transporter ATP-binding protein [Steroidobacteraceae bacterium]|nr:ABC transporter ATP-binding protein [Steroidobacteraceae bacterium]
MQDWRKLLSLFPRRDRLRILALLASTTVTGLLQAVGVAAIMPFIAVVADPGLVRSNPWLARAYSSLEFEGTNEFLVFLGICAMAVLLVTNVLVALNAWLTFRVCHIGEHDLSRRLLRTYLRSPWQLMLQRNSAELLKMLVSEVDRVVIRTLMAGIGVFSDLVTTLFMVALLLWIDPVVTAATLAVLGVAYGLIYALVTPRVVRLGTEFPALNTEAYKNAHEALAAAREIRIAGSEEHFVERFSRPLLRLSRNSIRYSTLDIIPAQALELIAFGGLIAAAVYLLSESGDAARVVPTIAMFGFAAYRLIPALKDLFDGLEAIRYNMVALEPLWRDFNLPDSGPGPRERELPPPREGIRLEQVAYTYPGGRQPALTGVDLALEAGKSHCLVGSTGAGKSTTLDVLLGLLRPSAGRVLVDGRPLGEGDLRAWQRHIGYVPQSVFLLDDSVAANIALGVEAAEIDMARVERAARIAQVHDFIVRDLPQGYGTLVGERGASLSGGQRQRIGIARALYRDPPVLVLDEATNELDLVTELKLLDALRGLGRRTIVFVSHRATVAGFCDQVAVFEGGRVAARGDYESLTAADSPYRSLLEETASRRLG